MRVACHTIADFITNLRSAARVYGDVVYVNLNRNPVDGNKRTAVAFEVVIQAYAVVLDIDGGECLLASGEECGRDHEDSRQERGGSDRADALRTEVEAYCGERGWTVRPGEVSE